MVAFAPELRVAAPTVTPEGPLLPDDRSKRSASPEMAP
jgi:hypothetical protein